MVVVEKLNALRQFKHCEDFDWLRTKCLQAIFVPKRLLRWAPLLFLGDRTDCPLCVAAGHFCPVLWLPFPSSRSPSQAVFFFFFLLDLLFIKGLRKPFYLTYFSVVSQTFPRPAQIFIWHYVFRNRRSM